MQQPESNQDLLFYAFTRDELAEILENLDVEFSAAVNYGEDGGIQIQVDIDVEALTDAIIERLEKLNV